jgi:hypothetical protein
VKSAVNSVCRPLATLPPSTADTTGTCACIGQPHMHSRSLLLLSPAPTQMYITAVGYFNHPPVSRAQRQALPAASAPKTARVPTHTATLTPMLPAAPAASACCCGCHPLLQLQLHHPLLLLLLLLLPVPVWAPVGLQLSGRTARCRVQPPSSSCLAGAQAAAATSQGPAAAAVLVRHQCGPGGAAGTPLAARGSQRWTAASAAAAAADVADQSCCRCRCKMQPAHTWVGAAGSDRHRVGKSFFHNNCARSITSSANHQPALTSYWLNSKTCSLLQSMHTSVYFNTVYSPPFPTLFAHCAAHLCDTVQARVQCGEA